MQIPVVGFEGYEAEDVIGTLAARAKGPVAIVSGDRDLFQLVRDPNIWVLYPRKGVSDLAVVNEFLEYAQVYGDYYATPKHPALDHLSAGKDVLLEIDVQGALQVRYHYPDALLIFILPPDEPTLLRRLTDRGRDSADDINKRFRAAKREIHMAKGSRAFDYMVINDSLDRAVEEISKVIHSERTGGL